MPKHLLSYELALLIQQLADAQDYERLTTAIRIRRATHCAETRGGPVR